MLVALLFGKMTRPGRIVARRPCDCAIRSNVVDSVKPRAIPKHKLRQLCIGMQAAGRSCTRVLRAFSQAAAASAESSRVITQYHASSSSCSSTAFLSAPLPSLQACLQSPGHSIITSAAASQKQIDAATREDWHSLTREQKKQALKPDKNRNHFKRMWKKDLQIKHAHQTRKRQQAAADAQHQKTLQEKWRAGASMWQSTSKISDVTESQ